VEAGEVANYGYVESFSSGRSEMNFETFATGRMKLVLMMTTDGSKIAREA
jgi:hypothetical protein